MASTFALAPIPIWVILEDNGKPASGCIMYPRSTLDHDLIKNVFQDPAGLNPWPLNADGGIVFNGNGTQGPFYWEDTGVPNDKYYLTFYSQTGQLIYTVDNYPIAGSGGSTPVTTLSNITNFILDGQFSYNLINSAASLGYGTGPLSPIPAGQTQIMPIIIGQNAFTQGG